MDLKIEKAKLELAKSLTKPANRNAGDRKDTKALPHHRIQKEVRQFANFTSLQGFNQAKNTDRKASKALWICLFIFGMTLTVWGVWTAFNDYFSSNFSTKVENIHPQDPRTPFEFPAVTICNANRIHCRNMLDLVEQCHQVNIIGFNELSSWVVGSVVVVVVVFIFRVSIITILFIIRKKSV